MVGDKGGTPLLRGLVRREACSEGGRAGAQRSQGACAERGLYAHSVRRESRDAHSRLEPSAGWCGEGFGWRQGRDALATWAGAKGALVGDKGETPLLRGLVWREACGVTGGTPVPLLGRVGRGAGRRAPHAERAVMLTAVQGLRRDEGI